MSRTANSSEFRVPRSELVEFSPHEIEAARLNREIADLLSGRQAKPLFGSALSQEQCADCGHMTPRRHLK